MTYKRYKQKKIAFTSRRAIFSEHEPIAAGNIPLNIDVETKKIGLELILGYLLAEIAELKKENAEIPELREKLLKFAEVEAENAKLKQIIEENARRDSENAELKSRVGELEARLALLEQGSAVDGMALSFGQTQNDKEAMPVVTVPTVDVPDSVIDQLNNEVERAPSDLRSD
ncbi:uncharacterized protein OCT59_012634 [Rhizophagus irregularis]|uniref:uncharacterized protein n=1 Tax=Rhizophagus irregularis TaxID=588596 RepID=UPI0033177F50|nr:hypothetical protein OCT59_012634 [Rhizophagus irregularis]